ncbi:MAG: FAD-dependent oxidoreductase, partial [Alphaproteobacteria bacterium]|nr:FAD-dependent oxidoreductase [Alphaproteobacteria bacterium]
MLPIYDFVIVGAGMAGASLGAELSTFSRVLLLEAEDMPGYHATGRSAAFWSETYGGAGITPLTIASKPWFDRNGFLAGRGKLHIGCSKDAPLRDALESAFAGLGVTLDRVEPGQRVPGLLPEWTLGIA